MHGPREARRQPAGERQDGPGDAEGQDEDEPPEKVGRRHQRGRAEIGGLAAPGVAQMKEQEPAGEAQRRREQHGERRELDRRRHGLRDQARDAAPKMDRGAEIAFHRLAEPDGVLLGQRAVEAHLLALRLDLVLGGVRRHRHGGRIDRKMRNTAKTRAETTRRIGIATRSRLAKRPRS